MSKYIHLTIWCVWIAARAYASGLPTERYRLTITVIDSTSRLPLEAASIVISELHTHGITNEKGTYTFDSLTRGWYTIQCSFVGYHPQQRTLFLQQNQHLYIELCSKSNHLHEVEITAHQDELPTYSLQSRQALSAVQLSRNAGNTIAEQLKQLSGITLLSAGAGITKPVIRGLHSNRLVTLNNGIRQEGQQWGTDHGTEIDPFSADKLEVIKGASGVEFGAEAIGGVVRVLPKPFKTKPGIDGLLRTNLATNNGLLSGNVLVEGLTLKGLAWNAQASARKAGDSRTPDYVLSNTGYEEMSGQYALHYVLKNWHVEFYQSYYSGTLGILRAAHVGNTTDLVQAMSSGKPAFTAPFSYRIDRPNQVVQHLVTAAKVYHTFKDGSKLHAQFSVQQNQRKEYDRPPRWATSQQTNPTPQYYLFLQTQLAEAKWEHRKWRNTRGVWGASWMNQGNVSEGIQPIIPNFRAYTYGVYLIEKWMHKRWLAELGLRYDIRKQNAYKLINTVVNVRSKQFGSATISSGVGYWISDALKITATLSSAWRAPSMNELYSFGLHGGTATFEIGNESLLPERSYNTEIELSYQHQPWKLQGSVYFNKIQNYIYKTPLATPLVTLRGVFPQLQFIQHDAVLAGSDFLGEYNLTKRHSFGVQASYLYAQNRSTNRPLIFMPANRVNLQWTYEREKIGFVYDAFLSLQGQYVATQYRYTSDEDLLAPPPAYFLGNINVGFETHLGKKHLNWSFSVYNILNTKYRDYLSRYRYFVNEPGLNIVVRVSVPLQLYQPNKNNQTK